MNTEAPDMDGQHAVYFLSPFPKDPHRQAAQEQAGSQLSLLPVLGGMGSPWLGSGWGGFCLSIAGPESREEA